MIRISSNLKILSDYNKKNVTITAINNFSERWRRIQSSEYLITDNVSPRPFLSISKNDMYSFGKEIRAKIYCSDRVLASTLDAANRSCSSFVICSYTPKKNVCLVPVKISGDTFFILTNNAKKSTMILRDKGFIVKRSVMVNFLAIGDYTKVFGYKSNKLFMYLIYSLDPSLEYAKRAIMETGLFGEVSGEGIKDFLDTVSTF